MKKLLTFLFLIMFLSCGCSQDKAGILFNRYPITEQTIYNHTKTFSEGQRIYYVVLMPKKVESRYLYIQVVQKDNEYGQLGYNLIWTKDVRLKDEEVNYFTDYLVLYRKGHYVMQVYSKDNPHKVLAESQFFVGM